MPSIDLKEKKELQLNRANIINLLCVNAEDAGMIDDIIDDIENQVVERIKGMKRVAIPFIGAFVPNEVKLDALRYHPIMKAKRKELTKEEYNEFRRNLLISRFSLRRTIKSRTVIISKMARLNRKLAERKLREFGKDENSFRLYMYFFSKMKPVNDSDYYIKQIDDKGYDYEDCSLRLKFFN